MLKRTLGTDIEVRTQVAPDIWHCRVDWPQPGAVLINLADNARDAMHTGGVRTIAAKKKRPFFVLDATGLPEARGGEFVQLTVSDTGAGMTSEVIRRAVEPFFTTKDVGQGTGLGLSVAHGFARQSGGDLTLESKPGSGTSLHIDLPRGMRGTAAADDAGEWADAGLPAHGRRILLVEDNLEVATMARSMPEGAGDEVLSAEDGHTALNILESRDDIDLLFTDVAMPRGMTGIDLAERAAGTRPGLKINYSSGYSDAAQRSRARSDKPRVFPAQALPQGRAARQPCQGAVTRSDTWHR